MEPGNRGTVLSHLPSCGSLYQSKDFEKNSATLHHLSSCYSAPGFPATRSDCCLCAHAVSSGCIINWRRDSGAEARKRFHTLCGTVDYLGSNTCCLYFQELGRGIV